VSLLPTGGGAPYDQMSGDLVSDYTNPTAVVSTPSIKVARGEWSLVRLVLVRDSRSRGTARGEVGGRGRGYEVDRKRVSLPADPPGACEPSCWFKVKVTRAGRTRLPVDFLAYDRGSKSTGELRRSVVALDVVDPPRLLTGRYRGPDDTGFTVRRGRRLSITDFSPTCH